MGRQKEQLRHKALRGKMPLDTKVRWKGGTLGFLILTALVHNVVGSGPKCNKIPPTQVASQTRGDHGFAVVIAGSPRLYRPGQVYTVTHHPAPPSLSPPSSHRQLRRLLLRRW